MKKDLKNISANNNLDFYFNEKNIPAQDIVKLTHDYFENGVRKGIFKPLDFLNLLWEQYNFVVKNINDAEKVINTLNNLPLSKEKKHILFGFILKWFGGYPINYTPKEYDITLKLIEKEFLGYNESTPEKKFCQKELERINEMKKVSNYFNDLLKKSQNYKGISLNEYIDEINPLEEIKEQCEIIFTDLAKDIEENRRTTKDVLKGLDLLISAYSTPNIKHNINNDRIIFFKDYLEAIKKRIELLYSAKPPQQIKTKADLLKEQLSQYGFFELEKVKTLSEQSKVSIIEKIAESGLPYAIAMFDYLQFIPYLEKKHFDSKYKLNREVSKWFDSDKEGRAVKGNISSLLKNTTENKDRYTAYKHKENVIKDYELLK